MMVGLVGKPNAGKSTFLRAATLAPAEISSRPFTTIKPNHGIGYIRVKCPCKELGLTCTPKHGSCVNGQRFIPVDILDVAGLVPGASEGRGLGNQFLDDLRRADTIIHVVDTSGLSDAEGKPGKGDPLYDTKWLVEEFELWLEDIITRALKGMKIEEELTKRLISLGIKDYQIKDLIKKHGLPNTENKREYARFVRKTKPVIIAANKVDLPDSKTWLPKLNELGAIHCLAESELALKLAAKSNLIEYVPGSSDFKIVKEISGEQKAALEKIKNLLEKFGSTGVQQVLEKAVDLLDLIVVYPVEDENKFSDKQGNVLPDAHLVPSSTTSRELAYRIHTDIGEGFVAAIDARKKMKLGADKPLKDGAIVKIQSKK
jgi:ribosome-binding ATPase YchF (GTP1/OBG family)